MLTEVCQELKNWFDIKRYFGKFAIVDGQITSLDDKTFSLQNGQYFRIIGSLFNDGVHKYEPENKETDLKSEEFDGAVWSMAVPPVIVALSDDIAAWQAKYGGADSVALSPFSSESFGGYSYSKAQGFASTGGGMLASWQAVFAARLRPWRKL